MKPLPTDQVPDMVDADGLDVIEALVADATAVEGVANVHEGSSYFAERVIRRAVEQGTLIVIGPETHPAHCALAASSQAPSDMVERVAKEMARSHDEQHADDPLNHGALTAYSAGVGISK